MSDPWFQPSVGDKEAIDAEIAADDAVQADAGVQFFDAGNSGAAITLDYRNGEVQRVTLNASAPAITVTHMPAGHYARLRLYLKQDGAGSRLLPSFVPSANYGVAGAPTLSTTAAKTDVLDLTSVDGGTTLQVLTVSKGF